MNKTISFILALLICLPVIAACADTDNTAGGETTANTNVGTDVAEITETTAETVNYDPGLPDANYGGADFTILTKAVASYNEWGETSIWSEAENGEVINDAIIARNRFIEETYKVSINEYQSTAVSSDIQKSVQAGDGAYDVVMPAFGDSGKLAAGGFFIDLFTLPYVDFTKSWWDNRSVEDLTVTNKLFFVGSDISTLNNDATWCTVFNKVMIEDYKVPSPYDLVSENQWTYENFYGLYKSVTADLDGDGEYGAYDLYPNLTQNENYNALYIGGGEKLIEKNNEDVPIIGLGTDGRSQGLIEILNTIMGDKVFSLNYHNYGNLGYHLWTTTMFEESRGLFWTTNLQLVIRLRGMETSFGIVPVPKYDSAQEKYCNVVWTVGSYVAVPKTVKDTDMTGLILEAMAAKSMEVLRPAYYDIALNGKILRDEESIAMLDIVIGERVYDLGLAFDFGGISAVVQSILSKNSVDLTSAMAAKEVAINTAIEKTVTSFTENT